MPQKKRSVTKSILNSKQTNCLKRWNYIGVNLELEFCFSNHCSIKKEPNTRHKRSSFNSLENSSIHHKKSLIHYTNTLKISFFLQYRASCTTATKNTQDQI